MLGNVLGIDLMPEVFRLDVIRFSSLINDLLFQMGVIDSSRNFWTTAYAV